MARTHWRVAKKRPRDMTAHVTHNRFRRPPNRLQLHFLRTAHLRLRRLIVLGCDSLLAAGILRLIGPFARGRERWRTLSEEVRPRLKYRNVFTYTLLEVDQTSMLPACPFPKAKRVAAVPSWQARVTGPDRFVYPLVHEAHLACVCSTSQALSLTSLAQE